MEHEDNKLKELKSNVENLTKGTQDFLEKKYEQKTGTMYEDRWYYWKRSIMFWPIIILVIFGNMIFSVLILPNLTSNYMIMNIWWIVSIVLIISLIYLIQKKIVYKK